MATRPEDAIRHGAGRPRMIVYLDTSAYVKLYVAEPGSDLVEAAKAQAGAICTHLITSAELSAILAKAVRAGRLTSEGLARQLLRMGSRLGIDLGCACNRSPGPPGRRARAAHWLARLRQRPPGCGGSGVAGPARRGFPLRCIRRQACRSGARVGDAGSVSPRGRSVWCGLVCRTLCGYDRIT